jgi:hypothetical protein
VRRVYGKLQKIEKRRLYKMPAPTGNKFWLLRSKHGRDKLFASPTLLWKAACQYFDWCENNPLMEVEQAKGNSKPVQDEESGQWVFPPNLIELPKMRAFTLHGLCLYLDCNTAYFRSFKAQERAQKEDFSTVIAKIEEIIYNQKFTGAAAGFLNANIIARDLGLKDKIETELTGGIQIIQIPDNGRNKIDSTPTRLPDEGTE